MTMTVRERCRAVLNFQPVDRLPLVEWAGWWHETIHRWHREGLPSGLTDRYEICRYFGLDVYRQDWIAPFVPPHGAPVIRTIDEYRQLRPTLFPANVVDRARWQAWAAEQRRGEVALWFTLDGFFWFPRRLLGIEPHLYAFYDQPEWLHMINADLAEWNRGVLEAVLAICTPDFMTFGEDLSYNNGPMLSREQFDEFLRPYYARLVPRLKERGVVVLVDTDGDVTTPAHWFEAAGLDGILPLERQAGVDIARLRAEHPRMRFIGHFDKLTMNRGEAAMRAEFERLLPVAREGGFIISCDHQTPPGVSLEDYRLYVRLFREYAEGVNAAAPAACY